MESRWYLFHGQTLENTKISERAHALHISENEWNKITKHLDRKKLIKEALDKEEAVKRYLDEGSKSMTKGWENSLENVRKRKEEERQRLIEQKKDDRMTKFFKMREEQEIARKKFVDKVRHDAFMKSGTAKSLTSAYITSEILYEREKQKEFVDKLKQQQIAEDREFAELVKQRAIEEIQENEEKKRKETEKNKMHGKKLRKIIDDKLAEEKRIREERIQKEAYDNIVQIEEMALIKEHEEAEKLRRLHENYLARQLAIKQEKAIEIQKEHEERELEEVIEIYKEAKEAIDCMEKLKAEEMRAAAVRRRDAIAKLVMAEAAQRDEEEELRLRNAQKERDAAELSQIQARKEKDRKIVEERLADREEHLKLEQERLRKEEELKKWELINRLKVDEYNKKYDEIRKKQAWEKVLAYRKELNDQIKDNKEAAAREQMIDELFAKESAALEDQKFYEYAEEVLEMAKRKGRSTYPIEKVIEAYSKSINAAHPEAEPYCEDTTKMFGDAITVKKILMNQKSSKRGCRCNKQK